MFADKIILKETGGDSGLYLCAENAALAAYDVRGGRLGGAQLLGGCRGSVFDAVIDGGNNIHILLGDDFGGITYIQRDGGRWSRGTLLKARENGSARIGGVSIFRQNMLLSAVYTVLSDSGNIVCHQLINGGSGEVTAIDRIEGERVFSVLDGDGSICVFYTSHKERKFGYRRLARGAADFGGFTPVTDAADVREFFALPAPGRIFLCFKAGNEIRFRRIEYGIEGSALTREVALTRRHGSGCLSPLLVRGERDIELMWGRGNAVFSSMSLGGGERGQRLTEERLEGAAELYKICIAADGGCRYEVGCRAGGRLKDCRGGEIFVKNAAAQNEVRAIGSRAEDFAGIEHKNKSYDEIERQKEQIRKKLGITGGNDDFEVGGAGDSNMPNHRHGDTDEKNGGKTYQKYDGADGMADGSANRQYGASGKDNATRTTAPTGNTANFQHITADRAAAGHPRAERAAATDSDASARGSQYAEDIVRLSSAVSELKSELARLKSYIKFINGKNGAKISAKHNKNI